MNTCFPLMKFLCLGMVTWCLIQGCRTNNHLQAPNGEVMYHVVQRSFYDSDGDLHGDLNGLKGQLDYLQELGVTSILLLPLYESVFYHNYFPTDFKTIDPEFGTMEDYVALVREIHRRGMKLYMDMEVQYVTEDHLWYRDALNNPASEYTDYILWKDSLNQQPSSIIFDLDGLLGYDSEYRRITTLNMRSDKVLDYATNLFRFFADPNGDGEFSDGVDGFRLDHMMDHLDYKPELTDLFNKFWSPLIEDLKTFNPDLIFMAEQAEWASFGEAYLKEADVDWIFGFRLGFGIRNFDKKQITESLDSMMHILEPFDGAKNHIVFIANHDVERYSTSVDDDPGKLRVGAALNLLLPGVPSIYYGQEIGMRGSGGQYGPTDGNEIPVREAFEWYADTTGRGIAMWYRNTGPWWDDSRLRPYDGISLEEQRADPGSLWNHYKQLIQIRKKYPEFQSGTYRNIQNDRENVFSFLRELGENRSLVLVNLSDTTVEASEHFPLNRWRCVFGHVSERYDEETGKIQLQPNEVLIFRYE